MANVRKECYVKQREMNSWKMVAQAAKKAQEVCYLLLSCFGKPTKRSVLCLWMCFISFYRVCFCIYCIFTSGGAWRLWTCLRRTVLKSWSIFTVSIWSDLYSSLVYSDGIRDPYPSFQDVLMQSVAMVRRYPRIHEVRRMSFGYSRIVHTDIWTFTLVFSHGDKSRAGQGAPWLE